MPLRQRLWPAAAELALAFSGLLVGWLVVGIAVVAARAAFPGLADTPVLALVAGPLVTVVAAVAYAYVRPEWVPPEAGSSQVEPAPPTGVRRTIVVVMVATAAAIGGSIALGLLLDYLGLTVEEQRGVLDIAEAAREGHGWRDAIALTVAAIAIAPAAEEVLFRGLLFRRIQRRSGLVLAYGVSALAFAAIHDNPAGFAIYAWLGVCFAAAIHRTGRVGAAIAVHVANNTFVLANLFLLAE